MKKVFLNNWVAKHFLPFAHTITIGPFVLSKRESLSQYVINHECVHVRQWVEMTVAAGLVIWALMLMLDISAWWMLLAAFAFYILYLFEFLIRFCILRKRRDAYRAISFEREARNAEHDYNYLENSRYFSWLKYLKNEQVVSSVNR